MNGSLLAVTVAGMELCWVYALLQVWRPGAGEPALPMAGLLGLYGLSFGFQACARRFGQRGMRLEVLGWAVWGGLLLLLAKIGLQESRDLANGSWVFSFLDGIVEWPRFPSLELVMTVAGALLWWGGARLEKARPGHALFLSEFQFGVAILLIIFFVDGQRGTNIPGLYALTLLFFLFAVLGLALAHGQSGRGWVFSGQRGRWLGLLVMVVCLVMTLGLLLGALLRPDLLSLMLELLKAAWTFVAEWVARVFSFLFSLFPAPESKGIRLSPPQISPMDRDPSFLVKLFRIPEAIRRVGEIAVGCLWILLFLIALWRMSSSILAWLTRKVMSLEGVEVEPLSGAFLEDLRALARFTGRQLARVWRWLGRIAGWKECAAGDRWEEPAAREVYRKVLRWAARKGCPRDHTQTPREYLGALAKAFPDARWDLAYITHQYVRVRYGSMPVSPEAVEKMQASWNRIKDRR
jgi:hypothetical protein